MVIERAVAIMNNGRRVMLRSLLGRVRPGEVIKAQINEMGAVQQIMIKAKTGNQSRYTGQYEVLVQTTGRRGY